MPRGELPDLIRGLLEPSAYPHSVDTVELVQTHISYVFLAGDFVDQPGVTYKTARRIEARSEDTVLIEVEGEPIGMLPATFEITGKRLKVVA